MFIPASKEETRGDREKRYSARKNISKRKKLAFTFRYLNIPSPLLLLFVIFDFNQQDFSLFKFNLKTKLLALLLDDFYFQ